MAAHYKMIQDVVANDIHWKGECVSAVCRVRWNSSVPAFGSLSMRLLCAAANSSPRWVRLEEGVIRVADGRGIGDLDSPTPVHLKIHDCGAFDLELAIGILTLRWRGDRFQDIPMLDLLAFFQAIEVIESRGFAVKQAFAHHESEVALPQNPVELVVFEYEARLREYPGFRLKAGFVVFTVAIVLVEMIQRLVLRRLVALSAKDHIAEVSAHHGFVRFGFVEIDHLRRSVELGSSACVRSRAFVLHVVPVLDDQAAFKSENLESHLAA